MASLTISAIHSMTSIYLYPATNRVRLRGMGNFNPERMGARQAQGAEGRDGTEPRKRCGCKRLW